MNNFWQQLPKPFFVLAPMADVTDAPFRRLIAKYSKHKRSDGTSGGADVTWTEFVSADGLAMANKEGKEKLMADLMYTEEERPIVAQLFSSNEKHMYEAAKLCKELGFNGVDINMGCPDRSIEKQGCGAAMIKNPDRAKSIVLAAKEGAGDIPVSVKTRLGYNHDQVEEWIPEILTTNPAALTVHARTRKEMSKVPARWERIKRVVEIRDELQSSTLIIGNGDVLNVADGRRKAELSGADGVMFGRAIFGNPHLFSPTCETHDLLLADRLEIMVEHTKLFTELLPFKNFSIMKKHYKAYVNGFHGAAELRSQLMQTDTLEEVEIIVNAWLATNNQSLIK
ncbi:tRNA-dihydrouridine synthase [bacterium]|nr:tRNA-dihydrouridine synthase [bacterium]